MSLTLALFALASAGRAQAPDPQNTLVIETRRGNVVLIKLRPDLAPKHVERRSSVLAKEGFYNGINFHRVIAGFMAQTGDPTGTGTGGSKLPDLPAEFTQEGLQARQHRRGAHGQSQQRQQPVLHLLRRRLPQLTGQYTLWGEVIEGMDNVDKIARGEPPPQPDKMLKVYLLADKK